LPAVGTTLVVAIRRIRQQDDHKGRPYIILSGTTHYYRFRDDPITSDWLERAARPQLHAAARRRWPGRKSV